MVLEKYNKFKALEITNALNPRPGIFSGDLETCTPITSPVVLGSTFSGSNLVFDENLSNLFLDIIRYTVQWSPF